MARLTNFSFESFLWNVHRKCLSTSSISWCKTVKNDQKLKARRCFLKAEPLEDILVIFGRRALIFLFESSWKKMKMTPLLCACAVVITLETKNVKKGHLDPSNLTFFIIAIHRNGFRRMKEEEQIYKKFASDFLIFAWGISYDLSKFSDDFTPFFRLWETITNSIDKSEAHFCSHEHDEQVYQVF